MLLILSLWGGIGAIMFLLFQNATQPFYFLVMWPLPLMLVAWWLAVVSSRSKSLARGMLGIYAIAQIIQLSYFYPKVYVPRFSHSHLLEDFNIIPAMAEGRSFTIVNQFAEINQFHYYEKITGIEPRLAKSNAELVFIMCEDEKSPVCRNKGQNYKLEEPPVFINGLYIFMFRKNNSAP